MSSAIPKRFEYFLSAISEESPVFIGLGNHDILNFNLNNYYGYKELEKIRSGKIFSLDNESIEYQDMRITEFHPRHEAFSPSIQKNGKGLLLFNNDFEESGIEIPDNDKLYNIMICHNPKLFDQARSISRHLDIDINQEQFTNLMNISKKMSKFDLCLSGHLHNGYIPLSLTMKNPAKYMDKGYWEMPVERDIYGTINHINPYFFKKTDMCRGTIFVGGTQQRIIELSDGSYYYIEKNGKEPIKITEDKALEIQNKLKMTPIVISGGVNKYFNLPIDSSEITKVKLLKK